MFTAALWKIVTKARLEGEEMAVQAVMAAAILSGDWVNTPEEAIDQRRAYCYREGCWREVVLFRSRHTYQGICMMHLRELYA